MTITAQNLSDVNSTMDLLRVANAGANDSLFNYIAYLIYGVVAFALMGTGLEIALLVSAIFCFVITIPLLYLGLVAMWVPASFLGIIIFDGFIIYYFGRT